MGNCKSVEIEKKQIISFVDGTSYNDFYEFIEYHYGYNIFTKGEIKRKLKKINPDEFGEWTQYDSKVLDKILRVLTDTKFIRHHQLREIHYYSLMTFLDRTASLSEEEQSRAIEEILEKQSHIKKGHIQKYIVNNMKPHLDVVSEEVI